MRAMDVPSQHWEAGGELERSHARRDVLYGNKKR